MDRGVFKGKPDEYVADFLANNPEHSGQAHMAGAEFAYRQTQYQRQQAESAERAARAAEESAEATARYTRYTFWVAVFTAVAAGAAAVAVILDAWRS